MTKKRKLKFHWTCSDYVKHSHRFKSIAFICGRIQWAHHWLKYLREIRKTHNEAIIIVFDNDTEISFIGHYRRDLEKTHWHYYEKEDGTILHVPKGKILYVASQGAVVDERH